MKRSKADRVGEDEAYNKIAILETVEFPV